ncbi:MAG: hypothetical protein MUF73_00330 [Rhodobacteraceae bacterium]|jgi:hypothetical protein|nr:hypothetical protein [Paracoccaceae bacterium]
MTDTPGTGDDTAALRAAIEGLAARLDRIEAQAARPSALAIAQDRLTGAVQALRGDPAPAAAPGTARPGGLLWPALTVCAVLVALILGVELVEEVLDGLWHVGRWID